MISAPEDYGLTEAQTLAHTAEPDLPEGFEDYWAELREEVGTLSAHFQYPIGGAVTRVVIPSLRSVRIAGRLALPEGGPRGAVIALHGHETPDDFEGGDEAEEPWSGLGLITLRIRVRGYPPSTMDCDDRRDGWITHCIESTTTSTWTMRGAVADVMQAYRCLRRRFGADLPIGIYGPSLGGGLAVIAAAQLAQMNTDDAPFRLVLDLPDLGDWRWRAGCYCRGAGGLVNRTLDALRDHAGPVLHTLRLFDAALHAQRVRAAALCKLALRDDVVPAPTAVAVFNALAAGEKWRFVTPCGHFDGGLADRRRHALFERIHARFLDPDILSSDYAAAQAGSIDFEVSVE